MPSWELQTTIWPVYHLLLCSDAVCLCGQGAGDAFLGALGYLLACVPSLAPEEAVRRACCIATVSVSRPGAQVSFPSRGQLPAELLQP